MEKQDLDAIIAEALADLENGRSERHVVHARLHMALDRMRAFGMPPPDNLVELEKSLAATFETESAEAEPDPDQPPS